MDLQLLLLAGGVAATVMVVLLVALVLRSRGSSSKVVLFGGSYNLSDVRRFRPDAYAMVIDVDNKTVFWVPLKYQGAYYTFRLKGRVGAFIPVERSTLTVDGKPCFLAVRVGDAAIEISPELSARLKAASLRSEDMRRLQDKPFLVALQELYEKSLKTAFIEETTAREESLIDITPTNLYISIVEFLARAAGSILTSINALGATVLETGGAIERFRGAKPSEWGAFVVYIVVGIAVVVMVLAVARYLGI